jgi:hypothetical protein
MIAYAVQQIRPALPQSCSPTIQIRLRPEERKHTIQLYLSRPLASLDESTFEISQMKFDVRQEGAEVQSMIQSGTFNRPALGGRELKLRPREVLISKLSSGSVYSIGVIHSGIRIKGVGTFTTLETGFQGMMESKIPSWFEYFRYQLKEGWIAIAVVYTVLGLWGFGKKPEMAPNSEGP